MREHMRTLEAYVAGVKSVFWKYTGRFFRMSEVTAFRLNLTALSPSSSP